MLIFFNRLHIFVRFQIIFKLFPIKIIIQFNPSFEGIITQKGSEKLRKRRNTLDKTRKDAKELIAMIEKLPEDKKREVLGIVRGYALCAETENKEHVR